MKIVLNFTEMGLAFMYNLITLHLTESFTESNNNIGIFYYYFGTARAP